MKFKKRVYPILLHPQLIKEMSVCKITNGGIVIGANINLSDLHDILKIEIAKNIAKGKTFVSITEMLDWFAGSQVRNVATLVGNIVTASPISDLNPILMSCSAILNVYSILKGHRNIIIDEDFFEGYRKTAIKNDEVVISVEIPFTKDRQFVKAYKQARRRDDDISIVTAAFNITLENNTLIKDARLCFGGMGPTTICAKNTSHSLKSLYWSEQTLNFVFDALTRELELDASAPGGMADYRKSLCLSLFYKFFVYVSQTMTNKNNKENDHNGMDKQMSAIEYLPTVKPLSSQYFDIQNNDRKLSDSIGQPIPHVSALKHATGEAIYCDDIPQVQGELFLTLVFSTEAYANIINIDASEALAVPGVIAFLSAKDLDEEGNKMGPIFKDEEIFSRHMVTSRNCVIGAVVATTEGIARKAKDLVSVTYEKLKPVIITLEDAIAHKCFFDGYPRTLKKGNVKEVFKYSKYNKEGIIRSGAQEHFYLETMSAFATRKEDELEIICTTQHPADIARIVSEALHISNHKIVSKVKRIGGGFGGKETRAAILAVPVALAAYKLKKPIRSVLEREEDMQITGYRHPCLIKYKVAFNDDGKIAGATFDIYANAGNYMDISCSMMERAIMHVDNCYFIPNLEVNGYVCKTNMPSNTAFRGFGAPKAMLATESMIRDIASTLGKSYEEIVQLNLYGEGHLTHFNQQLTYCTLSKCWFECIETSDYYRRKDEVEEFNRSNRWKKKGIAILPTKYGISFQNDLLMQGGALVLVYNDGSVLLSIGGIEMGQGLFTKMIQVASKALDIDVSLIHISEMATDKVPNSSPTAGSISSDLYGMAVINACNTLKERLQPYKVKNPNGKWEHWVLAAYQDRISLAATGFYAAPKIEYNRETNSGNLYEYFTYGVACSEVIIDCLTGDHQVLRTDIVMDLGESLNPAIDIGQIEGAFTQGYGFYTLEEMVFSPNGEVLSRGPGAYKIPGFSDIPKIFNVSLLKGASNPRAVYSSKAVGEPPLFLAASIFFAIKEAIKSARNDAGVMPDFTLEVPATCARIRMACEDDITRQVIEPNPDPEWTLLWYLRKKLRLTGTKLGCAEGGCGACTVMVSKYNRKEKEVVHLAVNACLAPVCAMHGLAVTTVEGIGSTKTKLHPVQERIAKAHGSQCGFCTPGIVMSMYALLRTCKNIKYSDMEIAFQGNLCRCTGYRAIIEGYKTFLEGWEASRVTNGSNGIQNANGVCAMGKDCCKNKTNEEEDNSEARYIFDRSSFLPYDSSQEPIFPPELKLSSVYDEQYLIFKGKNTIWHRPTGIDRILELKEQHPDARIVIGNTEVGVEVKFKQCVYPVIIMPNCIPEMNNIIETNTGLIVGASVTLNELDNTFRKHIDTLPQYKSRTLKTIIEMLNWFAGKQIRNVAAIGGNIMTGSPISDLNPILMTLKVKLNLLSRKDGRRSVLMDESFFTGYRRNVVKPDEILLSVEIPFTARYQYVKAYKQAKRREDDIAVVTAAINVEFKENTNVIENINLAFGGMAPVTKLATKTGQVLRGKKWNEQMLEKAFEVMLEELPLSPSAPGGNTQFRRALTMSLFMKSYLAIAKEMSKDYIHEELIKPYHSSGADQFHGTMPKSSQYFELVGDKQIPSDAVGRPLTHRSAYKQATGEAIYCDDMPTAEGELYLAFVLSTKAHAKLLSVDPQQALEEPGVVAFYSAKDLTREQNTIGPIVHDEELFASEKVISQGQTIGVIVANDQATAQAAARKVKIEYEEIQPIIVTIEDAIKHNSFYSQYPKTIRRGDVNTVFEDKSNVVIEGECRMGGQEHFYLETHASFAIPKKEDDEMEIFCSSQHPSEIAKLVSHILRVSMNRIVARVKRIGGGFGGKESRGILVALPVALAAHKLNRPVRCMLDRDEDMQMTGTRHPFLIKYKVAATKEGKIMGAVVNMYSNGGYSIDLSGPVVERAMFHFENSYYIPHCEVTGHICRTNLPSNTAFRGFGGPQGMFGAENMIRDIAQALNKSAEEIAKLNLYQEHLTTHYGQVLTHCTLQKCWDECVEKSNLAQRKIDIENFNKEHRWRKRGISIVPTKFGIAFTEKLLNQAGALVIVYVDGSVLLSHGGTEMGQGLHTKMIQVASRVLGIDVSKIHVTETATDKVPNTSATAASAGSDLNGMAVLEACQTLVKRLQPFKEANPNGTWEQWVSAAFVNRVSLSATGFHATPDIGYDFKNNSGKPFNYFTYGVAVTEVEIDCLSGDHQVLRSDIVMDLGESINPAIDIGQIEGAFVQGYGLFTIEELIYSPTGTLYSRGPGAYKIPGFGDIPIVFNVSLLKGAPNPRAVYSSKAVGEPPLFLASSAFFAIKEAIRAARADAGVSQEFRLEAPATSARIRMACEDHITKKLDQPDPNSFVAWNVVP
ncbi:xanthine dehydrogenase isoform X3 [Hyposmocoma kahamanoa]|nr:xanthine dehydrogenase isoform X3 [Hyposmocoma kahamanoa]